MPRLPVNILTAVFLAAFAAVAVSATEPPASVASVDLAKTRSLLASWIQRKTFPDSITFAYYYADALQILDGKVEPDTRERLIAFVKRCQRDDGGFVSNPKYGDESNIVYTYYGLAALHLLGADDAVDRKKAFAFVRDLASEEGGIRPALPKKNARTLASTFYGVESLRLLEKLDTIDRDKTAAFILTHRTESGGFGATTKGAARPGPTSLAVRTLAALGALTEEIKAPAIRQMEEAVALLGTRGPQFRAFSTMQSVTDMVEALQSMGALKDVITSPIVEFVADRYIPENGGFGPAPGLGTTPPSTYQGLLCLSQLGALPKRTGG
jgi:prenyltransferase beta subunit